ncbi:MAG: tetratricopeptide repeat protein [Nitrospirae bacterium]|nr:tetratricopeptide repeat protein [Nitrospirota bacterium]
MNILFVIIVSLFLIVCPPSYDIQAALQNDAAAPLKVRASNHSEFLRIVLEGPKTLISKGKVNQKEKNIFAKFSDSDFTLQNEKSHVPCKRNNDTLVFSLNYIGDIKVFTLEEPSRLIIDIFKKAQKNKIGNEGNKVKNNKSRVMEKYEKKDAGKSLTSISERHAYNSTKDKGNKNNPSASFFSTEAEASTIQERDDIRRPNLEQNQKDKSTVIAADDIDDDYSFIPEKYKKVWSVFKKENNPYKVISELSANKPSDVESLAVYHFIRGEALSEIKRYFEAIEQLRLAYIYASNEKLKEVSLIKRAEAYVKLGFIYEAKNNYFVFIRDYPSSKYLAKAHLGMANSLSEIGYFTEAVEHYRMAGNNPEVMFNMANALQKLEKVDEAHKAYSNAMLVDRNYPERSPETYYLMGENLWMSGKLIEAKKILSTINSGPFRDNASISLGLIAMEESNNDEAIKHFQSVAFTRNIKVKVKALFNLSLAFLKTGKLKESISTLEEVRKNYPDSSMYDEALLVLSRLYKHEGRIKESVALLKELVYGNHPPMEAFGELEAILLEASGKTVPGAEGELRFTDLWREVGQWMLDETRGEFLLKMAKSLKPEGKPFLQLCSWLVENTSGNVRQTAALDLADYYAGLEDIRLAEKYFTVVKETNRELKAKQSNDSILRIEAKISQGNKNTDLALKNIMAIKEFEKGDFKLLGKTISDLKQSGSNNVKQATALYEKMINKYDGEAEDYVRLADILYDTDEESALKYYRTAYEKNPKDEWTIYRIGLIVDMPETSKMLGQLQKGDNLLSRMAKTKLMEINLLNKINEVYQ